MTLTLDIATELEHQVLREARRKGLDAKAFPTEHWVRYQELVAKRRAETLTTAEHAEMLAMIQVREEANVHRVECLAELAKRRQVPLRELMAQMGIEPTTDD
jgi:hypothetical protein